VIAASDQYLAIVVGARTFGVFPQHTLSRPVSPGDRVRAIVTPDGIDVAIRPLLTPSLNDFNGDA